MSAPEPYFDDGTVSLYLGDCREVLPQLDIAADAIVTDPPYGETKLRWDQWVTGWPLLAARSAKSLWTFGSMRMFGEHWAEFGEAGWQMSHDILGHDQDNTPVFGDVHVVWEKHNGSGFQNDRFKRVHEHALYWYRDSWADQHKDVPTTSDAVKLVMRRKARPPHMGSIGTASYQSKDGGPRLMRSVLQVRSMHGRAIHPTEKPIGILDPLIRYACPSGGLVLDLFAGSGSTLDAARQSGRRAIGIEGDEKYAEAAAKRLSQPVLEAS